MKSAFLAALLAWLVLLPLNAVPTELNSVSTIPRTLKAAAAYPGSQPSGVRTRLFIRLVASVCAPRKGSIGDPPISKLRDVSKILDLDPIYHISFVKALNISCTVAYPSHVSSLFSRSIHLALPWK